jgi:hypothetical protein
MASPATRPIPTEVSNPAIGAADNAARVAGRRRDAFQPIGDGFRMLDKVGQAVDDPGPRRGCERLDKLRAGLVEGTPEISTLRFDCRGAERADFANRL